MQFISKILLTVGIFFSLSSQANAEWAGNKVIWVHGFIADQLTYNNVESNDIDLLKQDALDYLMDSDAPNSVWGVGIEGAEGNYYLGDNAVLDGVLAWPASRRIEVKVDSQDKTIFEIVVEQAKDLHDEGLCHEDDPCIFITHSTGDLVLRHFLENQEDSEKKIHALAVLDLSGAGGGTELANMAENVFCGGSATASQEKAVRGWLQLDENERLACDKLGVMHDLVVSTARSLGTDFDNDPPIRLRNASNGFYGTYDMPGGPDEYHVYLWSVITHLIIPGADDSVVPAHSTCGSSRAEALDYCHSKVGFNGEVVTDRNAVSPDELYTNHYIFAMHGGSHSATYNSEIMYYYGAIPEGWDEDGASGNGIEAGLTNFEFDVAEFLDRNGDIHYVVEGSNNEVSFSEALYCEVMQSNGFAASDLPDFSLCDYTGGLQ